MRPIFVVLALLLIFGVSFAADNWTMDGDRVYWTSNNYTISAYPATSNELINHYQFINFTSTNPANILVNFSFVFDQQPLSGDVLLWQNTSHQVQVPYTVRQIATYLVVGVINYTASTSPCMIGDSQNLYNYNVTYNSGNGTTTGIACFDGYTQNGNNYTLTYSYNGTAYNTTTQYWNGWGSVPASFTYTQIGSKHIYTINNVPFNGTTNYQTKFMYSFPLGSSWKFNIYAHSGSPTDVINGIGTVFVELDPWWDSTWLKCMQITLNGTTVADSSVLLNISTTSSMMPNLFDLRFLNASNNTVLSHWVESQPNTSNAFVWVKIDQPITTAGHNITMCYNNSAAADTSNGTTTFIDFSDFSALTGFTNQTGTWTITGAGELNASTVAGYLVRDVNVTSVASYKIEAKIKGVAGNYYRGFLVAEGDNPLVRTAMIMSTTQSALGGSANSVWITANYGSATKKGFVVGDATYHILGLVSNSGKNWAYASLLDRSEGMVSPNQTANITNGSGARNYWGFYKSPDSVQFVVDYAHVRVFNEYEPTYVFGAEETYTAPSGPAYDCGIYNTTNQILTLNESINISGATCLTANASNITIDCAGFSITGNNSTATYGIYSNQFNTTIRNCNISNFFYGIRSAGINANFTNNTIYISQTGGYGISFEAATPYLDCQGATISANNQTGTSYGISLWVANNAIVKNCIINNWERGIATDASLGGIFNNNTVSISSTTGRAMQIGATAHNNSVTNCVMDCYNGNNQCFHLVNVVDNTTVVNVTSRHYIGTGTACFFQGIHTTATNLTCNTNGTGHALSILATAYEISITGLNILQNSSAGTGYGINSVAANVSINCNGGSISGNNITATYGIYTTAFNTTIKNCNISNFDAGIYFDTADNGTIQNNTVTSTRSNYVSPTYSTAIVLYNGANYNILEDNTASSAVGFGISIFTSSNYNTIKNSISSSSSRVGTRIWTSSNYNTITNLTSTSSADTAIYIQSASYNNITGSSGSSNYGNGIRIDASIGTTVINSSGTNVISSGNGFHITGSSHNTNLTGISASSAAASGIYIDGGSNVSVDCQGKSITGTNTSTTYGIYSSQSNTTIRNCNIQNFSSAVYLFTGADNSAIDNSTMHTTILSGIALYIFGANNVIASNSVINASGTALYGTRIRGCNNTIFYNMTAASKTTTGRGYYITADAGNTAYFYNSSVIAGAAGVYAYDVTTGKVTIDCQGATISGSNVSGSYGISSIQSNTTVKDCKIEWFDNSIRLTGVTNASITNNTFIAKAGGTHAHLTSSASDNIFYWNNFTTTTGLYVNDTNGSNYYNGTTEGNVWGNVMDGTVSIYGNVSSSGFPTLYIGRLGSGYSYGNETSLGKFSCNFNGCHDHSPLTKQYSACGALSTIGNVYVLSENAAINGSECFRVTAQNVTLDCVGYNITGNNSSDTYGFYTTAFNTTIKNCNISNFEDGIFYNISDNGTIQNNTVATTHATGSGVFLSNYANDNTIRETYTQSQASIGIHIQTSNYVAILNSVGNNTAGSHGVLLVGSNFATLVNTTGATTSGYGMTVGSTNSNITNSTAISTSIGTAALQITIAKNCTFSNMTANGKSIAIYINQGSTNNTIANSTATSPSGNAIEIIMASENNTLYNNTLVAPLYDLLTLDHDSGGNTFYWNNFTNTTGKNVEDANGSNYYNATTIFGTNEGNVYLNVINGSVKTQGITASAGYPWLYVGVLGINYPYNSSNSYNNISGGVDYRPLTGTLNSAPTTPTDLLPNGSESFSNSANINWTASTSADGNKLNYSIFFSNNSGATYNYLNTTNYTNYTWNTAAVPGFATYRVRVFANDSVNVSGNISSAADFTILHFTQINGTEAQVGYALPNTNPAWNVSIVVYGSGMCNYTILKSALTNNTTITNSSGGVIANTGNYTNPVWGCNNSSAPYNVRFLTELVNQTDLGPVGFVGIMGTQQHKISVTTSVAQNISYLFSYNIPFPLPRLYNCSETTIANCNVGALWTYEIFAFDGLTVTKLTTLGYNETVYVASWDITMGGGGGGGFPFAPPGNITNITGNETITQVPPAPVEPIGIIQQIKDFIRGWLNTFDSWAAGKTVIFGHEIMHWWILDLILLVMAAYSFSYYRNTKKARYALMCLLFLAMFVFSTVKYSGFRLGGVEMGQAQGTLDVPAGAAGSTTIHGWTVMNWWLLVPLFAFCVLVSMGFYYSQKKARYLVMAVVFVLLLAYMLYKFSGVGI